MTFSPPKSFWISSPKCLPVTVYPLNDIFASPKLLFELQKVPKRNYICTECLPTGPQEPKRPK